MTHVALITAKGSNRSIKDKNVILIRGIPALSYVIDTAVHAQLIDKVFVSTEDAKIKRLATEKHVHVIDRPAELSTPETNHGDVMLHGVNFIKTMVPDLDTVTVLLGNTVMGNSDLIDMAVRILLARPEYDSVMSVWQAQDDHPYRALARNEDGFLQAYLNIESGTSREFYPPTYFYDQGVWTFRHQVIYRRDGPNPWWWMGKKSFPIIREWITCRDFSSPLDVDIAEFWLTSGMKDVIQNMAEIRDALTRP